jgi:hypothetical protein
LANALGLTSDELSAELNSGKTLAELDKENGLDRAALIADLENTHQAGLSQSVADGILTQEQADDKVTQMEGGFEWMLDNMGTGAAYGIMGWRGGMLSRSIDQQGSNWQFTPGGCHGNYTSDASQNRPHFSFCCLHSRAVCQLATAQVFKHISGQIGAI